MTHWCNRFVVVSDSEIDNQPVALYESAPAQKFEEESENLPLKQLLNFNS